MRILKQCTAIITAVLITVVSGAQCIPAIAEEVETYTCDFSMLKNGEKLSDGNYVYGTSEDIIQLDEYTTAYLTYEGTYIDAEGKVYLTGENNGKGAYTKGSYIEFTAPSAGTISVLRNVYNYSVDENYTGSTTKQQDTK